jgi:acetyl-CoA carboxylase biotin carboxyl carrier protein
LSEKKKKTNKSANAAGGASAAGGPAGPMNVDFLQQLVSLMTTNDLNTVDLREQGKRIILKRGAAGAGAPVYAAVHAPHPGAAHTPVPAPSGVASGGGAVGAGEEAGLVAIKSPMVGTFYAASSPDAKPFVSVGSHVVKDETDVCIIEAMKVFNNIKSEVTGTIAKIQVTNGQTVEFGTVLFLVKPS